MRISFVVWCFAAATVEMLPSSAYAQVGGWEGEERVSERGGAGKARMPVVSADPDTPLGKRNQRTEGTLLKK